MIRKSMTSRQASAKHERAMNSPQTATNRISHEQLDKIVLRLVDALSPRRIILFGSHLYGQPTRDSDVDVMILVGDDGSDRFEFSRRGYAALRGSPLPVELHFRTVSAFDRRATVPASLEHEILQKGRVVYAAES